MSLILLGDVRWQGEAVVGDRPRALLAALAASAGRPVSEQRLIDLVWGEDAPANATKGLQVLVSRTRTACGPDAIVRDDGGYRLGVDPTEVDSTRLAAAVAGARAALDVDAAASAALAGEALQLADGLATGGEDGGDPLSDVRRAAAADAAAARALRARALSRTGVHADALPTLEAAHAQAPDDEPLLADLLRSEAIVRGPGAALERFDRYRRGLRERLGSNPGEQLQRAHRDLLAMDQPVRSGVRHDATTLLGRADDLARLRGLLASSRVVSIVGPGGLGKTRLAHVLARDASQPVAHVVELVGVTAPEDVVGELGSVLGVRDSVGARRALAPAQRADVRARIAQRLGQAPALLVLDNCEHLVSAVAELVAFLVSTTADLRVLTTSRAPLQIAAERVYQLGELAPADGSELFRQRAVAVRPGVQLDPAAVDGIVVKLDGLPLAIELAAAKVRVMGVDEIDRRLEDRFALLRDGDRSAPDRHRTLLAVIDWSWNLLEPSAQRALRRLALFHDGFTLEAAEAVLGDGALEAVRTLADQSLLSVSESAAGVRYRMLETVREFGRMQLAQAGEEDEARAAQRGWAIAYAGRHGNRLTSVDQFAAIDALAAEEVNLADELRDALAGDDPATVVQLLGALGGFWALRGEHTRLMVLAGAISDVVAEWSPPPELQDATRGALAIALSNVIMISDERVEPIHALLRRLGPTTGADPTLAGLVRVMLEYDPADLDVFVSSLERLAHDADRAVALAASQWLGHARENAGDPAGALQAAERALALSGPEDGPWWRASAQSQLAQLHIQRGHPGAAAEHARAALPVMRRLGALDDEVQLHALLSLCAIADGRLDEADADLAGIDLSQGDRTVMGGLLILGMCRAELALARGDQARGLRLHRESAAELRELRLPGIPVTGTEPWRLFGDAAALTAHAYYATGDDEARGRELFATARGVAQRSLEHAGAFLDYPVAGVVLFALGAWGLLRDAAPVDDAVGLLVLAERFAYSRGIPTMRWERIAPAAEQRAPGAIATARARYGDRPPPDLLGAARELLERLPA